MMLVRSSTRGAIRMRRLRDRRRNGVPLCVTVEIFDYEVEEMVRQDLLQPNQVRDRGAIRAAVGNIVETWFDRD